MVKLKSLLVLFIVFITSFSFMSSKVIEGKTENYKSLKKYIEKKNLPINLEKSLFLKKKSDFNKTAVFKNYNAHKKDINKFSIPDTYLFNKNGVLIDDDVLGGCIIKRPSFEGSDFYTEILKTNKILLKENDNEECNLNILKNSLCDYKGNPVFPFKENKPCLIFLWAKNKTSINALNDYITYTLYTLKISKEDVDFYFLNADNYSY